MAPSEPLLVLVRRIRPASALSRGPGCEDRELTGDLIAAAVGAFDFQVGSLRDGQRRLETLLTTLASELVSRHGSSRSRSVSIVGKLATPTDRATDGHEAWAEKGIPGTSSRDITAFPLGNWTVRALSDDAHGPEGCQGNCHSRRDASLAPSTSASNLAHMMVG